MVRIPEKRLNERNEKNESIFICFCWYPRMVDWRSTYQQELDSLHYYINEAAISCNVGVTTFVPPCTISMFIVQPLKYAMVDLIWGWIVNTYFVSYRKNPMIFTSYHGQYLQTKIDWDKMGLLLLGRAFCGSMANLSAGLLISNWSLFSQLLALAACNAVMLVGQVRPSRLPVLLI